MDTKIFLAPLSGITDLSFRLISREFGAKFCFFEMLDAKALLYNHPGNKRLMKTLEKDKPIAAQLLGADASVMLDAAQRLISLVDISFLDINSACPAKKVLKKRAGAYLLNNPEELSNILKKLSSNLRIPVTVKLRAGLNKSNLKETVKIAKVCEDSGASKVFIHGRIASQGYSGEVDYKSIKAVKKALEIPVFGSGNIFNPLLAKKMLNETGCDGILVARGALGNPWIFKGIEGYLKDGTILENPGVPEKKKALKKHLSYVEEYKEIAPRNKIGFMGKIAMWYLKGLPNAAKFRERISKARSYKDLKKLIDGIRAG